jgi:diaminopimelate decarboxylase
VGTRQIPFFAERVSYIERIKDQLLEQAAKQPGPFYVYDQEQAILNLSSLRHLGDFKIFYAVKSNPYHELLKTFVDRGIGLDVSSELELNRALKAGAQQIVATGPGKSEQFLDLILQNKEKIFLQLDSLDELRRVSAKVRKLGTTIACGVRVIADPKSAWNKFGVPLSDLKLFFSDSYVSIAGFHSHQSYNLSADSYCNFLSIISDWSQHELTESQRRAIEWIDIGGGFVPKYFEGLYSWNKNLRMLFDTSKIIPRILSNEYEPKFVVESVPELDKVIKLILKSWKTNITAQFPNAQLFLEPGRILSYSTMHIVLRVMDKKANQAVILDGGGNMIGYERYQYMSYVPTFNLSRFSTTQEQSTLLYGSLCTPDDIWGYYYYGTGIEKGDVILIPFQGDYTYTCAQPNFIYPIPPVIALQV